MVRIRGTVRSLLFLCTCDGVAGAYRSMSIRTGPIVESNETSGSAACGSSCRWGPSPNPRSSFTMLLSSMHGLAHRIQSDRHVADSGTLYLRLLQDSVQ